MKKRCGKCGFEGYYATLRVADENYMDEKSSKISAPFVVSLKLENSMEQTPC